MSSHCVCPPWIECLHVDGRLLMFSDGDPIPEQHRRHLKDRGRFYVYLFPIETLVTISTCPVCAVPGGLVEGAWYSRPLTLYVGDVEAEAREAKAAAEEMLRAGELPAGDRNGELRGKA